MKKIFLFCAALLAMSVQAEEITLNLYTAVDVTGEGVDYDQDGVMDSTYSESPFYQLINTNDYTFMFSHLPSGNSWGGISWEGFTLSKKTTDTGNQFECVAKGGLKGVGEPFVVGYYSEYYTNNNTEEYSSSNFVVFDEDYYPKEVYICQNSNTMKVLKEGGNGARKFTDKDTLALIITGMNNQYEEIGNSVVYYLAVNGKFNSGWEKVDLSAIGSCNGLSFRMTSTDTNTYGIVTPTYFALDGLTVSTSPVPKGWQDATSEPSNATKTIQNGQLVIIRNGVAYTVQGQKIEQ